MDKRTQAAAVYGVEVSPPPYHAPNPVSHHAATKPHVPPPPVSPNADTQPNTISKYGKWLQRGLFAGVLFAVVILIVVTATVLASQSDDEGGVPEPIVYKERDLPSNTTIDNRGALKVTTTSVAMKHVITAPGMYLERTNGLCAVNCDNGPKRMYSHAYDDSLLVSYSTSTPGNNWERQGVVAQYKVDEQGQFTFVNEIFFGGMCKGIEGMTSNVNGSVIAILCRGYNKASLLPGAKDLVEPRRSKREGCQGVDKGYCFPIGMYNWKGGDPMYVFEYTAGEGVTAVPDKIIKINHAVGGWLYGHHEIGLSKDEKTYFIHLKVQTHSVHEGIFHRGLSRETYEFVRITDGWGCGAGHALWNRMAYNTHAETWGEVCNLDSCGVPKTHLSHKCNSASFLQIPKSPADVKGFYGGIQLADFTHRTRYVTSGGPTGLLSLGKDGWIVSAIGPGTNASVSSQVDDTVGILRMPLTVQEMRDQLLKNVTKNIYKTRKDPTSQEFDGYMDRIDWDWLDLPPAGTRNDTQVRAGMSQIAHLGKGGENAERILIGWSPNMRPRGKASVYVIHQMNRDGKLVGTPQVLDKTGWGEDNLWATMPNSGCVVFPFAWVGDNGPGESYPKIQHKDAVFSNIMRLVSICP